MQRRQRARHARHSGQVMLLFAAALVAMLGFIAMAVDFGYLLAERRGGQSAADAAALFAAQLIAQDPDISLDEVRAQVEPLVEVNGFAADEAEVYWPPRGSTDTKRVQVVISHDVPTFFLRAVYSGPWRFSTSAIAKTQYGYGPYALVALDPSQQGKGVKINGGNTITIGCDEEDCGGIGSNKDVNMTSQGGGQGTLEGSVQGPISAVGRLSISPNVTVDYDNASGGQGLIQDPFASVTPPLRRPTDVCDQPATTVPPDDVLTLTPGHYVDIKQRTNVTLLSGVYCIDGEFSMRGQSSVLTSQGGVLLYFRGPSGTFDSGNGTIKVEALPLETYPEYHHIVMWYAEGDTCPAHPRKLNLSSGSGETSIGGAIYAKCSLITMGGDSDVGTYSVGGIIVGGSIVIDGNVAFNVRMTNDVPASQRYVYLIQ